MQLVLSNNRVLAHGENFIAMGGTVINTETNRVYQNATIAKCESCPSDIDEVGYEYHAGVFVPCAPYGKAEDGNILVACEDCATPKSSGLKISELAQGDCKIQCGEFTGTLVNVAGIYHYKATITFDFEPKAVMVVHPTNKATYTFIKGQTAGQTLIATTIYGDCVEWNANNVVLRFGDTDIVSTEKSLYVGLG